MTRTHLMVFIALFSIMLISHASAQIIFYADFEVSGSKAIPDVSVNDPGNWESETLEPFGRHQMSSLMAAVPCIKLPKDAASLVIHLYPVSTTSPTVSSKQFFHGKMMTALVSNSGVSATTAAISSRSAITKHPKLSSEASLMDAVLPENVSTNAPAKTAEMNSSGLTMA